MKLFKDKKLVLIFLTALIVRLLFCFVATDLKTDYYWEYGDIAKYIIEGKGITFAYFDEQGYAHGYQTGRETYPTAFVPIGYVAYLIPFLSIDNIVFRNILILLSHFILSGLTAVYLIKLTKEITNSRLAYLGGLLYALLPEFIYASTLYGTTQVYHFLTILVIYLLVKRQKNSGKSSLLGISVLCGLLIYIRSEFALFVLMLIIYWLIKKNFRDSLIISTVVVLMILPWQIRNYYTFDDFIPFTTTNGYNFWKGHSQYFYGEKQSPEQQLAINSLEGNRYLERELNKMYKSWAWEYIEKDKADLIKRTALKGFYFIVSDIRDPRSLHILYLLPWLLMIPLSVYGFIVLGNKRIMIPVYLLILSNILVVLVYTVLPRYQTMMKPLLIPFIVLAADDLLSKFKNFRENRQKSLPRT